MRGSKSTKSRPSSARHWNGISLACRWRPKLECWLGSFVIFYGIPTSIAKKSYISVIFRGVRTPVSPSGPVPRDSQCSSQRSAVKYPVKPPQPGMWQLTIWYHCRNNLIFSLSDISASKPSEIWTCAPEVPSLSDLNTLRVKKMLYHMTSRLGVK